MGKSLQKFNFSEMEDDDLLSKAERIISCMRGRPDFPSPAPTIREIDSAIEKYKAAFQKSKNGKYATVINKILKRKELETLLVQLPAYCSTATTDAILQTHTVFSFVQQKKAAANESLASLHQISK